MKKIKRKLGPIKKRAYCLTCGYYDKRERFFDKDYKKLICPHCLGTQIHMILTQKPAPERREQKNVIVGKWIRI